MSTPIRQYLTHRSMLEIPVAIAQYRYSNDANYRAMAIGVMAISITSSYCA